MKTKIIALFLLFVMVSGVTAYASDVSGAVYQSTVRITNNSTAASNVAVPFTLDSQYLIDYNFVSDNFFLKKSKRRKLADSSVSASL